MDSGYSLAEYVLIPLAVCMKCCFDDSFGCANHNEEQFCLWQELK